MEENGLILNEHESVIEYLVSKVDERLMGFYKGEKFTLSECIVRAFNVKLYDHRVNIEEGYIIIAE